MFFTKKRTKIYLDTVRLGVHEIKTSTNYKYLGLQFDQQLTWTAHLKTLCIDVEKILNLLRSIAHCRWGAHPSLVLLFYKAYIRSMDYGSIFYSSACNTSIKKLDVLQFKALRTSIGVMKSTPTNILLAETYELPLKYRRVVLAYNFLLKKVYTNKNLIKDLLIYYNLICSVHLDLNTKRPLSCTHSKN